MTKEQRKKRQEWNRDVAALDADIQRLNKWEKENNIIPSPASLPSKQDLTVGNVAGARNPIDPISMGNNLMQQNLAAAAQAEANRMRARNPVQIADLPTAEEWNAKNSLDLGLNRSNGKTLDLGLKHSNEKIAKSYDNMTPEEKADKWLDPSYKMTQDERYEAKKTAEDFMHQFDGMNMMEIGAYMKEHPEAEAQYQKMKNLTAKASTLGNAAEGFRSAFTNLASGIVDMGLDSAFNRASEISGISELAGANPEDVRAMLGKQVEELRGKKNDFFAPAEERARNAETQNPVAFGVGKFGGMAAQYALTNPAFDAIGAAAGLGKAGQFALNQVGQNLQDVALDTLPTYNQLKRGDASDEEIAREMAKNVGINVASNLGMGALGEIPELVNGVRNARNDVINAARNYDPQIQNAIESTETAARNIDAISNQIPKVNADEMAQPTPLARPVDRGRSVALESRDGATLTGEPSEVRKKFSDIIGEQDLPDAKTDIPKLEGGKKTSQTYTNTGRYGGGWNEGEYANYTDQRTYQYDTISERESVEAAQQMRAEEGREAFANRVMEKERVTSQELDGLMMEWRETVAEARTAEEAGQDAAGLWEESNRIFKKVQEQSTSNAQALQALAKWSRNTPEGLLMNAENLVNQRTKLTGQSELKKEFDKWAKRNAKNVEFSPEFQRDFLNEAEKLQGLDMDSREAKDIMARLGKMVNEQMPVKFNEKVQSFLMDNMLGNFRTLITRNAGGNLGLASAEQFAQRPLAAGLDRLVSKKTGRRTQAGMSVEGLKEYFTGMKKGILDEAHDVRTGLHTARSGENTLSRAIDSNRHVFKTKVMDKLDAAVKHGLSVGDRPFYEATYKQTLGDYQRLREQGVMGDVIQNLSDADFKQYAETAAKLNALSAVYQNDSALSNALMSLKNGIGELSQGVLGVDVLSQFSMPFVKTPANVVDRAIDYSPIGFVRNAIRTRKEGGFGSANFDQNRFVNETARNILGTGFMAGAGVGAANGLMSGAYSEDKDEKAAQRDSGMQEYALNLPDGYQMDISWIPVLGSNAVAAAAAVDAAKKGDGNALENLGKGLLKGGEAMFNQSMFQGMQRLFGGDGYYNSDNGIVGNMVNTVTSGFGQAIPSLVRQAAQVTDKYSRDTSNSGEGNYTVNSLMNNIPGLREQLAPRVDTRGNLVEENQGRNTGMKVLEDMILPGKLTRVEEDPLDTEASRLFEVTNNKTSFMPKAEIGDITVDDERPSNDEWVAYQQDYGKRMTEAGEALINSDAYSQLSDERKEKSLSNLYKDVRDAIKSDYTGKEVDGASKVYKEQGLDATIQYVLAQGALSEVGLQNNEANRELFHSGGVEAIEEKASSADMLKGWGLDADADNIDYLQQHKGADTYIPTLVDNGLKSQSQWRTYEQAKNVIPSLSAQDFSTTYNKINTDRNTSIKQDEITAYLNAIKASAAQAQQINKAYGNGWKKTLQQKDGKWVYK